MLTGLPAAGQTQAQVQGETAQPNSNVSHRNLVLCQDGTVKGWGYSYYGQLGTVTNYVPTPIAIPLALPTSIVHLTTTCASSFAILADGTLWAWGDNSTGQLGIGSSVSSTATPTLVPGLTNIVAVSGGFYHTIALRADGTVWSWGQRQNSALGTGSSGAAIAYTPHQIGALSNIRAIASGDQFAMALDASGHVWAWGMDTYGELGLGLSGTVPTMQWVPAQLALANVHQIEGCNVRAGAVLTDGTVYTWGSNSVGQLGLGHSNFVNTPAQVGAGTLTNIVSLALNNVSSCAVQADGHTYVWGSNDHGSLGVTTPAFASTPIAGPFFSPNVQVFGTSSLFTSTERDGTVKVWGNGVIGYTPVNPSPYGGSYVPTTPSGLCAAVPPVASFPACGPQRAYHQRSGATYIAALHGNTTSPAEIGTYGTTTVIDASQPPYNGTVVFDGIYHLKGDVKCINGTFSLPTSTVFYVDSDNGQAVNAPNYVTTTILVEKATLQLRAATLRSNCSGQWGGVALTGYGIINTGSGGRKGAIRSVIQDAGTGVYCYTPDWSLAANTNEYYLLQTDFINNNTGLYDLVKGTAQPGEGARFCSFRNGSTGIQLEAVDVAPGNTFGGDYSNALFDYNTFENLGTGMSGVAGQAHITNSTFINNYHAAISLSAALGSTGEIRHNTITVPSLWPAGFLAGLDTGVRPTSYGIYAAHGESQDISDNTIEGGTSDPTANNVVQIGMALGSNSHVYGGNRLRFLDQALNLPTNDHTGSTHRIEGNTFTDNLAGITFFPYSTNPFYLAAVNVSLRCNTFSSTLANATGVWVTAKALFPGSLGTATAPNGNRFDGIADVTKRFVYDATSPFQYFRYNSPQERFGTTSPANTGDVFFNSSGQSNPPTIAANNSNMSGSGACGLSSSTPGVYARSAMVASPVEPTNLAKLEARLSEAYPNPAGETVSFSYSLPVKEKTNRVVIRNIMGHIVESTATSSLQGEVHFSLAHLSGGIYTVALEINSHIVATQKLIVQH